MNNNAMFDLLYHFTIVALHCIELGNKPFLMFVYWT